jgi:hypothetical protein
VIVPTPAELSVIGNLANALLSVIVGAGPGALCEE